MCVVCVVCVVCVLCVCVFVCVFVFVGVIKIFVGVLLCGVVCCCVVVCCVVCVCVFCVLLCVLCVCCWLWLWLLVCVCCVCGVLSTLFFFFFVCVFGPCRGYLLARPKKRFSTPKKVQNQTRFGLLFFSRFGPSLPASTGAPCDGPAPPLDLPSAGPALRWTCPPLARLNWGFGPPGLHTTTRELQTCTFERPGRFKHHQNSTRGLPRERRKNEICGGRGKKKREMLGPPPFGDPFLGASTLRAQPSGPPPFGAPTLRGPHPSGPSLFLGLAPHPSGPPPFGASTLLRGLHPSGPSPFGALTFFGFGTPPFGAPTDWKLTEVRNQQCVNCKTTFANSGCSGCCCSLTGLEPHRL